MMTSTEENQASNALVAWFKSQELGVDDATVVMLKVLAGFLVQKHVEAGHNIEQVRPLAIATETIAISLHLFTIAATLDRKREMQK